jgi:hypothetical protein
MKKAVFLLENNENYAVASSTTKDPIVFVRLDMIIDFLQAIAILNPSMYPAIDRLKDQKITMIKNYYRDRNKP